MTRAATLATLAFVSALAIAACGGGASSGAPAQSPPPPPPESPAAASAPSASAAEKAEEPAPGAHAGDGKRARGSLESAQRELDVAAGDCRAACRALGSMDRAAGTLCKIAQSGDDRAACTEATSKVRAARDKVRATCGGCPGGPSVDHDAPVPSPPTAPSD